MRDDDESLPNELSTAIELLRADEPVRPEWRAEVLRRAAAARRAPFRVSMSVPWAIAAGVACAIAGAAASSIIMHRGPDSTAAVATANGTSATILPVRFSVTAPNAARVSIVGDFNDWNPTTLPMRRSADGRMWEVEVRLLPGRYSYAFMIDGKLAPDPRAPRGGDDDFGAPNSVVMVKRS